MKNKEKYDLTELIFKRFKKTHDYTLKYVTKVYKGKDKVDIIDGGAMSNILAWLEHESN